MRLSDEERGALKEIVLRADPGAEIYLFGSRTEDALKGGDIDLLIVSERLGFPDKIDLLVQMKNALGEQKIDVLIKTARDARLDPFARRALESALRL